MAVADAGRGPGPSLKAGPIVEGVVLAGMLAVLALGFVLVRPASPAREGAAAPAPSQPAPTLEPVTVEVPVRPPTHLVLLVDDAGQRGGNGGYRHAAGAGPSWVRGVELVDASNRQMVDQFLGLRDALRQAPCDGPACLELVLIDLRGSR